MSVEQRGDGDFMVTTTNGWLIRVYANEYNEVTIRAAAADGQSGWSEHFWSRDAEEIGKACLAAALVARRK